MSTIFKLMINKEIERELARNRRNQSKQAKRKNTESPKPRSIHSQRSLTEVGNAYLNRFPDTICTCRERVRNLLKPSTEKRKIIFNHRERTLALQRNSIFRWLKP